MSSGKKMTSEPINDKDYNEAAWAVIESYFAGAQLQQAVRHQIESYNNFVQVQIPKTISMFNPVHIKSEHDYVESVKKYSLEIFVTLDAYVKFLRRASCGNISLVAPLFSWIWAR